MATKCFAGWNHCYATPTLNLMTSKIFFNSTERIQTMNPHSTGVHSTQYLPCDVFNRQKVGVPVNNLTAYLKSLNAVERTLYFEVFELEKAYISNETYLLDLKQILLGRQHIFGRFV